MEKIFKNDILPLKDRLFRLALRITLNRQEAEDVVQDTLLKMWARREEWSNVNSLEAMAVTICRNQALDYTKKAGRSNMSIDVDRDSPIVANDPSVQMENKEGLSMARAMINDLPEVQRSIMVLREVEGQSFATIADELGMNESQVRVYLHRARQKIKKSLSIL
ncbi:MAG: RNA polymerase sigma factor [Bacteroidaceae bacterium]|nr:RNA polymerase sigma factor [Bacteroidaceae bacterium]